LIGPHVYSGQAGEDEHANVEIITNFEPLILRKMLTNMTRTSPVRVININYPVAERSGFEMQPQRPQRLSAPNDTVEVENTAATRCTWS
jgi:hypothetical protein